MDFDNRIVIANGGEVGLKFENNAVMIDPAKSADFELNKVYNIDNLAVIKGLNSQDLSGFAGLEFEHLKTTDDVFIIEKATLTKDEAMAAGRSEVADGFKIKVDSSRSTAAASTQNAVNNSVTRSAFIGNVVGTAVNVTLTNFNAHDRMNHRAEVDIPKLEKYASFVADSNVLDQTYAKDSHTFVMPYYTSTSVDLATGDNLDGDTYGIISGMQKSLGNDFGVLGFFVGVEKADVNAVDLGIDDTTFYAGVNYYKTLGGTTDYDYFAKGMLRGVLTSSDIASLGESVESDSNSYGFEVGFGANFYVANHTLTPELAISYDRVNVDGFTMRGNIYQDNNINLFMGKLGASWQAQ